MIIKERKKMKKLTEVKKKLTIGLKIYQLDV